LLNVEQNKNTNGCHLSLFEGYIKRSALVFFLFTVNTINSINTCLN